MKKTILFPLMIICCLFTMTVNAATITVLGGTAPGNGYHTESVDNFGNVSLTADGYIGSVFCVKDVTPGSTGPYYWWISPGSGNFNIGEAFRIVVNWHVLGDSTPYALTYEIRY